MKFKIGYAVATLAAVAFTPAIASAHNTGYQHYHQQSSSNDSLATGLLGAGIGALAGSQIAGRGDRTEGAFLGAVVGGVAGAALSGNNNNNGYYNNGYYNNGYRQPQTTYYQPQTGYYGGGYNTGYGGYQQPHRTTYTTTYSQPTYYNHSRPVYSNYGYGHSGGYYTRPRTAISINLGSSGRHYRGRSYNRRHNGHSRRRHHHNSRW